MTKNHRSLGSVGNLEVKMNINLHSVLFDGGVLPILRPSMR